MIHSFDGAFFEGFELLPYKDVEGSHRGVVRQNLLKEALTDFEVRFFAVQPGGFSSFEQHEHEHFVVILSGRGEVRLGNDVFEVGEKDLIRVEGNLAHQFRATGDEPLGVLCVVDRVRDRPRLVEPQETSVSQGNRRSSD